MLKINLICVGNLKEKFWKDAENEYLKRLSAFCNINVIEIKEANTESSTTETLKIEGENILKKLKGYIIICDISAKSFTSEQFASKLEEIKQISSEISFVIGSSYGLCDMVKKKADLKVSFSSMTFAHNLFRIMLEEQIYRAFMITAGRSYHK